MEVVRQPLNGGSDKDFRIRQTRARQLLRGELEGEDLERYVEERVLMTTLEQAQNWARANAVWPLGFGLAWLIDKKFRGHALWTTVILIPMMLSPAVVGNFWTFLYQPQSGLFNYVIAFVSGIDPSSFQMLGSVRLSPWAIVIVDVWMWTPYVMLICLAGLRSIPEYIYEAAEVDRASPWRQFWPRRLHRSWRRTCSSQ